MVYGALFWRFGLGGGKDMLGRWRAAETKTRSDGLGQMIDGSEPREILRG